MMISNLMLPVIILSGFIFPLSHAAAIKTNQQYNPCKMVYYH
jgi:hypothetical protein